MSRPPRGQLVLFTPPKRPRGRPKRPTAVTPSMADFAQTAAAIVAVASGKHWHRVKQIVRARARIHKGLNPAARELLSYLLDVINRERGYDWRSVDFIAAECAHTERTVRRSFDRLVGAGLVLREVRIVTGNGRANKQGRTTIPAIVDAAIDIANGHDGQVKKSTMDRSEKPNGGDKKIPNGPSQENPMVPPKKTPLTLSVNTTPTGPSPSSLPSDAMDGLIPFDDLTDEEGGDQLGVSLATEAHAEGAFGKGTVGSILSIGRVRAARAALPPIVAEQWRLPFTPKTIAAIRRLCLDPKELAERYFEKTTGQKIRDPSAYLIVMAYEEAAKRDGCSVALVASQATGGKGPRASAAGAADVVGDLRRRTPAKASRELVAMLGKGRA